MALAGGASAEWASQTLTLRPGWNAIFLEVQPQDSSCATLFAGLPLKSVWSWNGRFTSVQYVRDPSELLPEAEEWLTYFPANSPNAFLTTLRALLGGHAYLVELGGAETVRLDLRGRVKVEEREWLSNSFNLAGFHIDPKAPPTFSSFFAASGAHVNQPMYRLDASGVWRRIEAPAAERIQYGAAYWIYCAGESKYAGPVGISIARNRGLNYGQYLIEKALVLRNETSSPRLVTLTVRPSARPSRTARGGSPGDGLFPLAGEVKLAYRTVLAWQEMTSPLTLRIKPNSELEVPFAVLRNAMSEPASEDDVFESVLEVVDGQGAYFTVPVTAQKMLTKQGLWVGEATLFEVSEAANGEDARTPRPAGSDFRFRLIVHVDADNNATLLQQVILMQVQAVFDPPDSNNQISPDRDVLITRDELVSQFTGISLRDGKLAGRRISAPAFAHTRPDPGDAPAEASSQWPIALGGALGAKLNGTIRVNYKDPLNPFLHRYHPDHNNLNEDYDALRAEGSESFTFSREIELEFSPTTPLGRSAPNWGHDVVGGTYRETIIGLHKNKIYVEGSFELNHVIDVNVLNDGL